MMVRRLRARSEVEKDPGKRFSPELWTSLVHRGKAALTNQLDWRAAQCDCAAKKVLFDGTQLLE